MPLRIMRLIAANVKGIKAIDITTPEGENVIKITGANAQGKSSVLDAITMAIGGAKCIPAEPIRHGEKAATIQIHVGEFIVERSWTDPDDLSKTYLAVRSGDAQYNSPQQLLNSWVDTLSFDPLAFAQMDSNKQMAVLTGLLKLDIDLDEWKAQKQGKFEQRTGMNRRLKELKAQNAGLAKPDADLPAEETSVAELSQTLSDQMEAISKNQGLRRRYEVNLGNVEHQKTVVEKAKDQLETAKSRLQELKTDATVTEKLITDLVDPDINVTRKAIQGAEGINIKVRDAQRYRETEAQIENVEKTVEIMTGQLKEHDAVRDEAMKKAKFPIDGLSLGDDGVMFQDTPFDQLASSEQLRVSLAMAMALNPELRVIRIMDGSLLDSENLQVIETMAKENDYQVWIESVDESGKVGIVIEAGEVVANNYDEPPAPDEAPEAPEATKTNLF